MTNPIIRPLLQRMLIDILSPHCSYHIYTNYVYQLPNRKPASLQWCCTPLSIDYESLRRAEFLQDGMICELIHTKQLSQRINIPYQQIFRISRSLNGQQTGRSQDILYNDLTKVYPAQN